MTDTAYRRPGWLRVKLINPLFRTLVLRAGLGRRGEQNLLRVLRVRGRRSGREYDVPVRIAVWEGRHYVVSLRGEAHWARNLRASATAELLTSVSTEPVVASELRSTEKVAFLHWYCRQPAHRVSVRTRLKVDPRDLSPSEIDRLVRHHPVFRLDPPGNKSST